MSTCPGLGANTDVNGKLNQFCKAYLKKMEQICDICSGIQACGPHRWPS